MAGFTIWLTLVAAAGAQQYDDAAAMRDVAQLQAAVRAAGPIDTIALQRDARRAQGMLAHMARCDAVMAKLAPVSQALEDHRRAILHATPQEFGALDSVWRDLKTADSSSPEGKREAALKQEYEACVGALGPVPEPTRTCARLTKDLDDLDLEVEQRWLRFRGPMPNVFHDKAEVRAYRDAWRRKRAAFDDVDALHPDAAKRIAKKTERDRVCRADAPVPSHPTRPAEPNW